jgi:hypothetical protein
VLGREMTTQEHKILLMRHTKTRIPNRTTSFRR